MGMEKLIVTPSQLRSAANDVDNLAAEYRSLYGDLLSTVDEFTSSDWQGKDATEFRTKVRDFEDDFNKMKQLMNDYATHLRKAADDYEANQNDISNQIKGLQS